MSPATLSGWREWGGLLPARHTDHVSIGTFCHGAAALRDAGLRRWSGPFDWIFSTPAMAAVCLADDFAGLLDPGRLVTVPPPALTHGSTRQCRHPVYESRFQLPIIFNHHDPAGSIADRLTLRRAVTRFRRALGRGRRTVFYLVSERPWPESDVIALERALAAYPADQSLAVVTLTRGTRRTCEITTPPAVYGRRLDVEVGIQTPSLGIAFADPSDNEHLARVMREIARRLDPTLKGHI